MHVMQEPIDACDAIMIFLVHGWSFKSLFLIKSWVQNWVSTMLYIYWLLSITLLSFTSKRLVIVEFYLRKKKIEFSKPLFLDEQLNKYGISLYFLPVQMCRWLCMFELPVFFFNFNLQCPLLIIVFYHQTKISIDFGVRGDQTSSLIRL